VTPEQVLAMFALIADLKLTVDRLARENADLRQALTGPPITPAE